MARHVSNTESKVVDDPESVQLQHTNGFRVDDHILIEEHVSGGTEFHHASGVAPSKLTRVQAMKTCHRLMRVTRIQDVRGKTKCATIEGVYYFFRHEIPKKFISQMPSLDLRYGADQEIFRSSFPCTKRADQFVKVCQVIDGDTSPRTLLRQAKLQRRTSALSSLSSVYFCRSRFKPVHRKVVFSPLTALQHAEYVRNVELEDLFPALAARVDPVKYQCHPDQMMTGSSNLESVNETPTRDPSLDLYRRRLGGEDRVVTRPFLSLVTCLCLAVGNIVRVWHRRKHTWAQILVVDRHEDGSDPEARVSLQLSDGKIRHHVSQRQLLCLVAEDEALRVLSRLCYQGALALVECAHLVVVRQNRWLVAFRKECQKHKFHLYLVPRDGGSGLVPVNRTTTRRGMTKSLLSVHEGQRLDHDTQRGDDASSRPQELDDEDEEEEEDAKHDQIVAHSASMHNRRKGDDNNNVVRHSTGRKRKDDALGSLDPVDPALEPKRARGSPSR